jgi:HSP20 family protein
MANIQRRATESPLSSLRREIDQLFDDFFTAPLTGIGASRAMQEFNPVLELSETEGEYVMAAELPGLDEKDVEVSIDENVLTIRGEKKREEKKEGKGYRYSERSYGSFMRSVQLPSGTDSEHVTADFNNGVLEIHVPKSEKAHARTVPIGKTEEKLEQKSEPKVEGKSDVSPESKQGG